VILYLKGNAINVLVTNLGNGESRLCVTGPDSTIREAEAAFAQYGVAVRNARPPELTPVGLPGEYLDLEESGEHATANERVDGLTPVGLPGEYLDD